MTDKGMKMKQKSQTRQTGAAKAIKDIRRATRKQYSAEEKIRIVLDGSRGEETMVLSGECELVSVHRISIHIMQHRAASTRQGQLHVEP
jgi:hypothetical protein